MKWLKGEQRSEKFPSWKFVWVVIEIMSEGQLLFCGFTKQMDWDADKYRICSVHPVVEIWVSF